MKKVSDDIIEPKIEIPESIFKEAGFLKSGIMKFNDTVQEFCSMLFTKSIKFGDIDADDNTGREITKDHVKKASYSIFNNYNTQHISKWAIFGQIAEYIFTAIAGLCAGHLNKSWVIITFALSLTFTVLLIAYRLSNNN